jgi:competence ComEA-like helix-hairpin-helix protein
MWGREMRAGLVFVLVSLLAGSAFREWRRSHEARFADLVRELETTDATPSAREGSGAGSNGPGVADSAGASDGHASEPSAPGRGPARSRRAEVELRIGGIDVDRASAEELERLPGIGPSLAARIVEDRARNGSFGDADALRRVKGIGPRTLERIRPYLAAPRAPADSGSPIAN